MTTPLNGKLYPTESEGQRIGRMAAKSFEANCPNDWIPQPSSGTNDYGLDYEIQLVVKRHVVAVFHAQLKGSTSPTLSADGSVFSVALSASTVRYYSNITDPIMLVLCDLSRDPENPKSCPLYYQWVGEELRRLNAAGLPDSQSSITLHVPTKNVLDARTEIESDLHRFRMLSKAGDALDVVVEEKYPALPAQERAQLVARIPAAFRGRNVALLEIMSQEVTTVWPEAPVGSLPWLLSRFSEQLKKGAADEAEASLRQADALLETATPIEQAEYWLRAGRLHTFRLNEEAASQAFRKAAELVDYRGECGAAWAESQLRLRFDSGRPPDLSDVISKISACDEPVCVGMRARLLAAEGKYSQALEEIADASDADACAAKAVIHTMQGNHRLAADACDIGLSVEGLRDSTRSLFHVLRARALFNQAVGPLDFKVGDEMAELPMSGLPNTDIDLLKQTWDEILRSVSLLRAAGWTSNVQFVADIWPATASILGRQRDALPLLREAAASRPTIPLLHHGVESLAAQSGVLDVALAANAAQSQSIAVKLRRVMLLHMARHDRECVELFGTIDAEEAKRDSRYAFAASSAILSAERIIRPDIAATWARTLESDQKFAADWALIEYFRAILNSPLAKDDALSKLDRRYTELGRPLQVGFHLFHEYESGNAAHAARIAAIAEDVQRARLLGDDSSMHLALALLTLERWPDVLKESRSALVRFPENNKFRALEALALDRMGQAAEALEVVKRLIDNGHADSVSLNVYVNIVVRSGFIEEGIQSVERILSVEARKERQIECLRTLFNLVHMADPLSPRCLEVAWRIGQVADQDDEMQEGLFLMAVLAATVSESVEIDSRRKAEFQSRLTAFTKRFPESKMLRMTNISSDASADQLLDSLAKVAGFNAEREQWRQRTLNLLQRGEMPIPFAWRPRQVLANVPDVVTLWEVGKRSHHHERQYHLLMVPADWQPSARDLLRNKIPLLDLTTLFVVLDLELWDYVFMLFPKIAVAQRSLLELQRTLTPLSGSPFRTKTLELQAALKANFHRIVQPSLRHDIDGGNIRDAADEVRALVSDGKFSLYSDDAAFRAYCDPDGATGQTLCTLDVLRELDERRLIAPRAVAEIMAKLTTWHVALVFEERYQMAALPDSLGSARSVSEGIELIRRDSVASIVFSALWDISKPYKDLQGHATAILRHLCENSANKTESVAAVVGYWFVKARFHKDAQQPPIRALALVILGAAAANAPSAEVVRRLWAVFRSVVEQEYGDRMDVMKEREAIHLLGRIAAEVDAKERWHDERSLRARMAIGLNEGTVDWDDFRAGIGSATKS